MKKTQILFLFAIFAVGFLALGVQRMFLAWWGTLCASVRAVGPWLTRWYRLFQCHFLSGWAVGREVRFYTRSESQQGASPMEKDTELPKALRP